MPDRAVLGRLQVITDRLIGLYLERPTVHLGYLNSRADTFRQQLELGRTATAAKDEADYQTRAAREMFETLEADILALQEERDHLRLLLSLTSSE